MNKDMQQPVAWVRALRLLTASCNRIEADSEEFEGPDGATVGVPISSWEEFTEALDEARAALSAQGDE